MLKQGCTEIALGPIRENGHDPCVRAESVCGRFSEIYFRATKTLTITDTRWRAYHIELSSRLRKPDAGLTGPPTARAYRFCGVLAAALQETLG